MVNHVAFWVRQASHHGRGERPTEPRTNLLNLSPDGDLAQAALLLSSSRSPVSKSGLYIGADLAQHRMLCI